MYTRIVSIQIDLYDNKMAWAL